VRASDEPVEIDDRGNRAILAAPMLRLRYQLDCELHHTSTKNSMVLSLDVLEFGVTQSPAF
jgi:hypothetical protein